MPETNDQQIDANAVIAALTNRCAALLRENAMLEAALQSALKSSPAVLDE